MVKEHIDQSQRSRNVSQKSSIGCYKNSPNIKIRMNHLFLSFVDNISCNNYPLTILCLASKGDVQQETMGIDFLKVNQSAIKGYKSLFLTNVPFIVSQLPTEIIRRTSNSMGKHGAISLAVSTNGRQYCNNIQFLADGIKQ